MLVVDAGKVPARQLSIPDGAKQQGNCNTYIRLEAMSFIINDTVLVSTARVDAVFWFRGLTVAVRAA